MSANSELSVSEALAAAAAVARWAGRLVLDIMLPPVCLTCDAAVDEPGRLCAACFARTSFITEPCCAACGVGFVRPGDGGVERICAACRLTPPPWDRARAAMRYDAQAKRLVLPLKYHDRVDLAATLAGMMARAGAALLRDAAVIVPVPLHRRRLLSRRYNQAALIALALAARASRPALPAALQRVRPTKSLGTLSAAARARMVAGAFAVRPRHAADIAGRRVLLIDDVLTSGATCGGCTRALLAAGAESVDVLVAARVPAPGFGEPDPR